MTSSVDCQKNNGVRQTLKSVVYSEFLRKAMIPILFVEVALIAFYFLSVNYMTDKTIDIMSQTAKQNLINLSEIETRYINDKLEYIRHRTYEFHQEHSTALSTSFNSFANDTLPTGLPWESGAIILNADNKLLVSSQEFQKLVDANVMGHDYTNPFKPYEKHNFMAGNMPIDKVLRDLISGSQYIKEFQALGEQFFITKSIIEESGWRLIILTNLKGIYEPVYQQRSNSQNLGLLVILVIISFYAVFFTYLFFTSKRFAERITQPIEKISHFISSIQQQKIEETPVSYVKIKELDELIDLNVEIKQAKQKYLEINAEMAQKNKQLEHLAVTDPLTQAYNRLKLDEVLSYEIARARRDKNPLSIILLDIDKFKDVNDTYGHQAGDTVLVAMAQLLSKSVRRTDILGRWGGEEFLLVLPNTNLKNAAIQGEKLRALVERTLFDVVGNVTISLGISCCIDNCNERLLIECADKALYQAKESGRNCVKTHEMIEPVKLKLVEPFGKLAATVK